MRRTRITVLMAFLLTCCLLSLAWVPRVREDAAAWASSPARPVQVQAGPGSSLLAAASPLRSCETRIEGTTRQAPTAAIVGASYTAGVGPGNPEQSWAVQLGPELRWNAVVYGVSGAGFARSGPGAAGSMSSLLEAEDLPRLKPALVIVQAGPPTTSAPPRRTALPRRSATRLSARAAPRPLNGGPAAPL
jgi:hypothetical protein